MPRRGRSGSFRQTIRLPRFDRVRFFRSQDAPLCASLASETASLISLRKFASICKIATLDCAEPCRRNQPMQRAAPGSFWRLHSPAPCLDPFIARESVDERMQRGFGSVCFARMALVQFILPNVKSAHKVRPRRGEPAAKIDRRLPHPGSNHGVYVSRPQ
jgi:hypothetical protein